MSLKSPGCKGSWRNTPNVASGVPDRMHVVLYACIHDGSDPVRDVTGLVVRTEDEPALTPLGKKALGERLLALRAFVKRTQGASI
ncbi:hypothetical protein ACIHFE_09380 [Streptomyces sp. NPDC052396]|uniref:hypothetical protein n=1 Tax=Streptomyces sp. NPDC052396 TaxID=3365689 RepID=UPI0037D00498